MEKMEQKVSRMSSYEFGRLSERIALKYLLSLGLDLREKNWRSGHKEIDLIMESGEYLHIVEVRSLRAPFQVLPKDSVDRNKQKLLIRAASSYVQRKKIEKEVVFDIVSIVFRNGRFGVEYVKNAFIPIV